MLHTSGSFVRGAKSVHVADSPVVLAMAGQQIERTELIDRQSDAVGNATSIESLDTPVFTPEIRIMRFLPGLGVSPTNPALPKNLTQPFERDRRHDLLLYEIVAEFRQRPDAHADQLPRRRHGDLRDLFGHLGHKLPRASAPAIVGIPFDRLDAPLVETVNDPSHQRGGAVCPLGDFTVANVPHRE